MRPDHRSAASPRLLEVGDFPELPEDPKVQEAAAIKEADFTVGKGDLQLVVVPCDDRVTRGFMAYLNGSILNGC